MDHRNITECYRGIRLLLSRHNHTPFFSMHKEIPIYFKNNDVYQPSFTSQMINISMTLNWRTHGNTGKLFIIKMSSTDLRRRVRVGQKNDLSLDNTTL